MKTDNKKTISRLKFRSKYIVSLLLTFAMALGAALSVSAATKEGDGGAAYGGPDVNTFAASLPLATVYLDHEEIKKGPSAYKKNDADPNKELLTFGGSKNKDAQIDATKLEDNKTYKNLGSFTYTYQNAAVFPDGSRGDVVVELNVAEIVTAGTVNGALNGNITLTDMSDTANGFKLSIGTSNASGTWGVNALVDTKVSVTNDSGSFIIPANGANIRKNDGDTYYQSLFDLNHINKTYVSETIIFPDNNVCYPEDLPEDAFTSDGKIYIRAKGNGTGNNNYMAGMATVGDSGHTVSFRGMGCSATDPDFRANAMNLSLGDLQHRIWSGSGPHGSIATGKTGTGTDLPGGSFEDPGNIPNNFPTTSTLTRHVVPDAKKGVTYTMTPDKGYTVDKVVVDGTTYSVPSVPETSATIANSDGNGTLEYKGGGKFTYTFTNSNTKNHEIYVTWRRVKADIKVNNHWYDNSKAVNNAKVKLSGNGYSNEQTVPTSDGLVYTWSNMDVFEYDSLGFAGAPITYKLEEIPDPVSGDYLAAIWSGNDKTGGSVSAGFTLVDLSKDNQAREKGDPLVATLINTLAKEIEITIAWDDLGNKYETRPTNVAGIFKLCDAADDSEVKGVTPIVTPVDDKTNRIKWAGLPAFNTKGEAIQYYVMQTLPAGYTSDPPTTTAVDGDTITSKLITTKMEVDVTWEDGGDAAHKRPAPADMLKSFTLYDKESGAVISEDPDELWQEAENLYVVRWLELPKYNSSGKAINYILKETTVPDGYGIAAGGEGVGDRGTIKNKFNPGSPGKSNAPLTPVNASKGAATGDANTPGMWAVLFIASFLLMLLALRTRRYRR